MAIGPYPAWMLAQEAGALLTRLARVRPFALVEPMVPAANLSPAAQSTIDRHLLGGRRELRRLVNGFLDWLHGPAARQATPAEAQRRFAYLRHASPPSVAVIHAAMHALALNRQCGDVLRLRLSRRLQQFRRRLAQLGLRAPGGAFPVQSLTPRCGASTRRRYTPAWSAGCAPYCTATAPRQG